MVVCDHLQFPATQQMPESTDAPRQVSERVAFARVIDVSARSRVVSCFPEQRCSLFIAGEANVEGQAATCAISVSAGMSRTVRILRFCPLSCQLLVGHCRSACLSLSVAAAKDGTSLVPGATGEREAALRCARIASAFLDIHRTPGPHRHICSAVHGVAASSEDRANGESIPSAPAAMFGEQLSRRDCCAVVAVAGTDAALSLCRRKAPTWGGWRLARRSEIW